MLSRTMKKKQTEYKICNGTQANPFIEDKNKMKSISHHSTRKISLTQMLNPSRFSSKGKIVHPMDAGIGRAVEVGKNDSMNMEIDPPIHDKSKWKAAVDPKSGKKYYYDMISRKSTWDKPFELCTPEEQMRMKKKEREVKTFFKEMESNILKSYANANKECFSAAKRKSKFRMNAMRRMASPPYDMCCHGSAHVGNCTESHNATFSPTRQLGKCHISPDQVSSFPYNKFNVQQPDEKSRLSGENEILDEGIEMMKDARGNLFTSHVRRPESHSKPYSVSADVGKESAIKCICVAYRAHIIESTIRYYEGTLNCSETFNDSVNDQHATRLSHSSPLAHRNVRETMSQAADILELGLHYRGDDVPSIDVLVDFVSEIFQKSQMEPDCVIMALIYVERLMKKTLDWVRPAVTNWKCLFVMSIIMASKVWDDLSMINADFANICVSMRVSITLQRINELELSILHRLKYRVTVSSSEYTKYNVFVRSLLDRMKFASQ